MNRNKKSKFETILLLFLWISFISGTIPVFTKSVSAPVPAEPPNDDTSQIILFLDTAVLGPFCFPIRGKVISRYGQRGGRMHTGTDIKLSHGDTVRAAFTGVVTKAEHYYGYGLLVILKHPEGLETYYSHLSKTLVNDGDTVSFGSPLGLGGRTGRATTDHLHFEIRKNGKALNSEHFFNFDDLNIKSYVLLKNTNLSKGKAVETVYKPEEKTEKKTDLPAKTFAERKYHTIKKGDTLFSLSKKYSTTVEVLCKLNNLKKNSILTIGRKIRVN